MKKILITGGACAGKTTVLNVIKDYLEEKGYNVNIIEEVPTKLINESITSEKVGKMEFQELIIKTQIENEKNCDYDGVIIFDGSPIDSMKFINREEFDKFVKKYNTNFEEIINGYDGIIFLETVAKDYPELYSNENNKARLTDVNAAVDRNDKLFNIYNNNSKVYLIKPDKDIEVKKKKIIEVVESIIKGVDPNE
ncbi:MAG: ATP-binding protein [Clostridia bacterium]|nr:ATP-binding protein [Clostridia bacterium]